MYSCISFSHFHCRSGEGKPLIVVSLFFSPFLWPNCSRIFWPFSALKTPAMDNMTEGPAPCSPHQPLILTWVQYSASSDPFNFFLFLSNMIFKYFKLSYRLPFHTEQVGCALIFFTQVLPFKLSLLWHHTAHSHQALWPRSYARPLCTLTTCLSVPMNSWS